MPVILAPAGAKLEDRLTALERAVRQVSNVADSALQIGPYQKSPVAGQLLAGVINIVSPVGGTPLLLGAGTTTSAPFVVASDGVHSASVSVTATRATTYLSLYEISTQQGGGAGVFGHSEVAIDGALRSASLLAFDGRLGASFLNSVAFDVATVAAGSHTFAVQIQSDGVNTLSFSELTLLVLQLGS